MSLDPETMTGLDVLNVAFEQRPSVEELDAEADDLEQRLLDALVEAAEDGRINATVEYNWNGRTAVVERVRQRLEGRYFVVRTATIKGRRMVRIEVSKHLQQITT